MTAATTMSSTTITAADRELRSRGFSLAWLGRYIRLMRQVRRERRQLRDLDERALADLGLTEAMVRREVERAAWDLPARFDAMLSDQR